MIEKIFKTIGIEGLAVKIYLHLLENGPSPAGELARKMQVPRSSLYGYLGTLVSKGLAKEEIHFEKKYWKAEPVEALRIALEEEEEKIKKSQKDFEMIAEDLKKKEVSKFSTPSLVYFNGKEELKKMFLDIYLRKNLETVAFWSMKDVMNLLGKDFMEKLSKTRIKNNIDIRAIWPADKVADISKESFLIPGKEFLREVRIAPKNISSSMGFWAYEDKVLFISSKRETFGFIVESQEFADMVKNWFEFMWSASKPIKK